MTTRRGTPAESEVDLASSVTAHAAGAVVIDVREGRECTSGHVPGARSVPPARPASVLAGLPRTGPVPLICASGHRSKAGAGLLAAPGIRANSVAGGTGDWRCAGLPVVTGSAER